MTNNLYTLLKADERQVRRIVESELIANGYKPVITDNFIYAEGTVPVMLAAHYDTVLAKPPRYIHEDKGVLSARKGLGADDRAGVYGVLEIIKKHHCYVLITGGEETGGVGAEAFVSSGIKPEINYIIELDRRGENDAVYYNGANENFEDFITSFGWKTNYGWFTDICTLAPYLNCSAVNLSIGYMDEHRPTETLDTQVMNRNIRRVQSMLDGEYYKWQSKPMQWRMLSGGYDWYDDDDIFYKPPRFHEYYILFWRKGNLVSSNSLEAVSDNDALGMFLSVNPEMCYNDVEAVLTDDDLFFYESDYIYGSDKERDEDGYVLCKRRNEEEMSEHKKTQEKDG